MKQFVPEELFEKYLNGSLSEEEAEHLLSWLKTDQAHLAAFDAYKVHWHQPAGDSYSVDMAFSELSKKINRNSSTQKELVVIKPYRKLLLNISKAAAILTIGILTSIALYELPQNTKEIQWNTISAAGGQKSKVELADGTEIWLNSESTLQVPSNGFKRKERHVKISGEAYFQVAHNSKSPFTVQTDDYSIEVLGTEFNVMAYKDFKRTETTLVNGRVKIIKGENELLMKPGQTVVFSKNRFSLEKGKIEQAVSWKDNKFYFDAIPFSELILRLERWYDVDIKVNDKNLENRIYTGVFKNEETIWQVLDVIEFTTPIRYERTGFRKIEIFNEE